MVEPRQFEQTQHPLDVSDIATEEPAVVSTGLVRRVSWGAIFSGVVVVLATQLVLGLLGISIGLATVDPLTDAKPGGGLGLGAGIWWLVSSVLAVFFGSWVAARMTVLQGRLTAALHGLVTWGLASILAVGMLTSAAGRLVGGVLGTVADTLGSVGASAVATGQLDDIDWGNIFRGTGGQTITQAERDTLVDVLAARGNITRAEAEATVSRWERAFSGSQAGTTGDTRTQALRVADAAARTASQAAMWACIALVLGAGAALAGGTLGVQRRRVADAMH